MAKFQYSGLDTEGGRISGDLEAEDEAAAIDLLWAQNITPIEIISQSGPTDLPWWKRDIVFLGAGISKAELVVFFRSFATLAEARLPLATVLNILRKQTRNQKIANALETITRDVENGRRLSEAMEGFEEVFPPEYIAILKVGERSNTLIEATKRTALMAQESDAVSREVKSALIYPVILMILSMAVLALIVFHLAPTLQTVFVSSNAELPGSLAAMVAVRAFLLDAWVRVVVGVLVIVGMALVFKKQIRKAWNGFAFRAPLLGRHIKKRETARLAETLSAMLLSGARLDEALETVHATLETPQFQTLISHARESVTSGDQLSEVLGSAEIVDPILRDILGAAEEGDAYAAMLQTAAVSLSSDTRAALQSAIKLITPILTIGIALAVGGLILTTITAILDLNELAF